MESVSWSGRPLKRPSRHKKQVSPTKVIQAIMIGLFAASVLHMYTLTTRLWLQPRRTDSNRTLESNEKCSIYLAPSSIADANDRPAGFGVFTTRPLKKGDYLKSEGPNLISVDVGRHQKGNKQYPAWAATVFGWHPRGFNGESNSPGSEFQNIMMNQGTFANFHSYLLNIAYNDADIYEDNLLNRYEDPGAGAFSYHRGKKWFVTRDVVAGEELFVDYGEDWFFDEELGDGGKDIPRQRDYVIASSAMRRLVEDVRSQGRELSQQDLNRLSGELLRNRRTRAASLLPKNIADFVSTISNGVTVSDYGLKLAHCTVMRRSVEWIEENGRCLDNIVAGRRSTIPQAGQGAFASRFLAKGRVIAPASTLIQITDKSSLDMYRLDKTQTQTVGEPVSKQLLINYCVGHEKSSMLLCPGTNAVLINHCSTQMKGVGECSEKGPNAELRWALDFDPETRDWLNKSLEEIEDLVDNGRRGLSFEVVATRDIKPGDEIFMDYGPEWEKAWANHVATWKPPQEAGFISVTEMNNNIPLWLRTEDELKENPYPASARVGCFHRGFYHPCKVLSREGLIFKVRINRFPTMPPRRYHWYPRTSSIEANVSSSEIRFFPRGYSSDQHLIGAFRQNIGFRDDMWPDQWKDLL